MPAAADPPEAVFVAAHIGAEGGHGGGGVQHVLGLQKAGNPGLADGNRAQHQRAVRHRLVTRNGNVSRQFPCLGRNQCLCQ